MATVNQDKMIEIAGNISSTASKLKTDLNTAITAAENAKGKVEEAKAYDGQELKGNRSHYSEKKGGKNPKTIFYYAHVKADNGTAESGIENIIGKDKDNITEIIDKISTFAENDIPEVVACINEQREIVETGLADYEKKYDTSQNGDNFLSSAVTAAVDYMIGVAQETVQEASNLVSANNSSSSSTPTGSTGSTGYQPSSTATPQYRQPGTTQANTTTNPNTSKPNTFNTPTNPNVSNNSTNQSNNTKLPVQINNASNTPVPNTPISNTTTNTPVSNTPTETNTSTNPDNPTPGASVPTGSISHTGGTYSQAGQTASVTTEINPETDIDTATETAAETATSITQIPHTEKSTSIIPEADEEVSSSSGSATIPIAAGLSTAAAAAIGVKAIIDKNKENGEDLKTKNWTGDITTDIDYNDGIKQQEYLDEGEEQEDNQSGINQELPSNQ